MNGNTQKSPPIKTLKTVAFRPKLGMLVFAPFFSLFLVAESTASIPTSRLSSALYQVRIQGDQLVAVPGQAAKAQMLKIVDSTDCRHKVVGENRIEIQGPCTYLSALYHYVPQDEQPERLQVTGGFSFSRKNANSYILAVAKGMRFYPVASEAMSETAPENSAALAVPGTAPQLRMKPIPKAWLK